jgi:hypothetical protein
MNLQLVRQHFSDISTIGDLLIDGEKFCDTLEDTCRRVKIDGKTAIPSGKYKVIIDFSNRFRRKMPLLLNVPNFSGVRIHNGNTDKDTQGCVLVGKYKSTPDFIYDSAKTFDLLFKRLTPEQNVWLSIIGGFPGVVTK